MSNLKPFWTALEEATENVSGIHGIVIGPYTVEQRVTIERGIDPIILTNAMVWAKLYLVSLTMEDTSVGEVYADALAAVEAVAAGGPVTLPIIFVPDQITLDAMPQALRVHVTILAAADLA